MSHELHGDAAERAEVGMQRVALLGEHHAGERAGEHQVARLQRDAVRAELVGEPGDTQRRMAEHTGGHTGLLDLGVAVHDAADPAQVDVHRSDRPAADHDAGGGAVVGDGVKNLARVLDARVDDLDGRNHVFGRAQHIGQPDAGAFQRLAEHEGELDLHPRLAVIGLLNLGTVGDHHVVEQVPIVGLVDLRRALHRLGGEADLVPDQLCPGGDPPFGDLGGDRIGIFDGNAGPGGGELDGLFALLLCRHENVGGFAAIGLGQHLLDSPWRMVAGRHNAGSRRANQSVRAGLPAAGDDNRRTRQRRALWRRRPGRPGRRQRRRQPAQRRLQRRHQRQHGDDQIRDGDGTDTVYGDGGNDTIRNGAGNDEVFGGSGNDVIVEETADQMPYYMRSIPLNVGDTLRGGSGNDAIKGGGGHDEIFGDTEDDTLDGGAGDDMILGGLGLDVMTGGANADTFIWQRAGETGVAGNEADVIAEFNRTVGDRIDVSAVDAHEGVSGNQAFTFVGTGAITGAAQISYFTTATDTYVLLSTDADTSQEMTIRVAGSTPSMPAGSCCEMTPCRPEGSPALRPPRTRRATAPRSSARSPQ